MSINYYAVPTPDASRIGPIVEGADTSIAIETSRIHGALKKHRLCGNDRGTLKWEAGDDYIFVDVMPTHVLVTHNAGRGSSQLETLMEILVTLRGAGLHVYDPQQGKWFFS